MIEFRGHVTEWNLSLAKGPEFEILNPKTPQDLSPHVVIVMLVRPDIEGLKTLNIFCWPWILALPSWSSERTRGTSFLDSWPYQCKPRFSRALDSPGAHSSKLDIFSTDNYSKRCSCKEMMISSPPPTPQVFLYKINWGIFPIKNIIYTTKNLIPKIMGNSWGNLFWPKKSQMMR
jgi:hypothetical protein